MECQKIEKNLPNILTCKLVYSQTSMNYANET